jgi:hypothetical protein
VKRRATWAAVAAIAAACAGTHITPLYPDPGHRRAAGEVATLHGPIATVDGQDVSAKGTDFALLPGCHLVVLLERVGEASSAGTGAWSANLPHMLYAFRMRAGYSYVIDYQTDFGSGTTGRLLITAREQDPQGGTSTVAPAEPSDLEDCQRWKPPAP